MLLLITLIFPPYISLLYILLDVYKTKKAKPKHCFAALLLLAMIGIYWFPWGDSQSHFAYYLSDIVETYYSDYSIKNTYWLYDLTITKIANFIGNYTYGYFFWLLVPIFIFYYAINRNLTNKNIEFQLFLYLLLFLGIREYLDLNRGTSAYLLFIASILLFNKNRILCITCLIVSLLLHDTIRYYLFTIPLGILISKSSTRKINILYIALAIGSLVIMNYILPLLLSERNLNIYMGENWQNSRGVNSGFMYILGLMNLLIFIIQFVLIQINRYKIKKSLYVLFLSSSFIAVCGFSMWVMRERFIILSNIIAAAIIIINKDNLIGINHFSKKKILQILNFAFLTRIMIHLMLIYSAHFIYNSATKNNKEEFRIVAHSLYLPTIVLFDVETFGFSDKKFLQLYDRVFNSLE